MKARVLIAAFLVVFAVTAPVLAQGNGNGNGNSGQSDNGSNGNGNGNGTSDGNGNSGNSGSGNGNAGGGNNGSSNNGVNGAGGDNTTSTPAEPTAVPEEDLLLLVEAGQAVSLASLLPNVQARTGGQIIDAELVRTQHSLIYVVKVLTPEGQVRVEYYNARSGIYIEAR